VLFFQVMAVTAGASTRRRASDNRRPECLRRRQARYWIETFIACAPGGLSLTWSEVIFSDAPHRPRHAASARDPRRVADL